MSTHLRLMAALVFVAAATAYAAEVRITDHDQRFKAKYGVWPPHVRRAMEGEQDRERGRQQEAKRSAKTDSRSKAGQTDEVKPHDGSDRPCECDRQAN